MAMELLFGNVRIEMWCAFCDCPFDIIEDDEGNITAKCKCGATINLYISRR